MVIFDKISAPTREEGAEYLIIASERLILASAPYAGAETYYFEFHQVHI